MKFTPLALLFFLLVLISAGPCSAASVNIPLDSSVYNDLETLSLRGLISSDLLSTKPITRTEAGRLALEALENLDREGCSSTDTTKKIIAELQREFRDEIAEIQTGSSPKTIVKPVDKVVIKYNYLDGPYSIYNNEGVTYLNGHNAQIEIQSYGKLCNFFSYYLQPMVLYNQGNGDDSSGENKEARLQKGYFKFGYGNLEIEAGRDSLWWGPGFHGSLLMSNNAHPFDMIKISNPKAMLLPSIFEYLGPFKFNLIFSELNDHRPNPYRANPYLYGLRIDFKPHPIIEIGLSQICLFGGAGNRNLSFTDIMEILYSNENRDNQKTDSNQQVAMDLTLTIPNLGRFVPLFDSVKLYGEWGAEDTGLPPDRRAYLVGIALNDVLHWDNLKLRIEYANTSPNSVPGAWYNHRLYPMQYNGRVFGHFIGSDAEGFVAELSQDRLGRYSYKLEFDKRRKGLQTEIFTQDTSEIYLEIGYEWLDKSKVMFRYGYERIQNFLNVAEDNRNNHFAGIEIQLDI